MTVRVSKVWAILITGAATLMLSIAVNTTISGDEPAADWIAPPRAARKANPVPANAASIEAGKALYVGNCMPCHGVAGKGDGPAAFALDRKPRDLSDPKIAAQSDGSIFWKLTEGRKPMPSFETLMTEPQRWQVINYVRTLQPPPAKPSSQPATQPH